MLILSRKKGESIKIGDDIEIFVSEIKGDKEDEKEVREEKNGSA